MGIFRTDYIYNYYRYDADIVTVTRLSQVLFNLYQWYLVPTIPLYLCQIFFGNMHHHIRKSSLVTCTIICASYLWEHAPSYTYVSFGNMRHQHALSYTHVSFG